MKSKAQDTPPISFLILFIDDVVFFLGSAVQLDVKTEVMANFAESYVVLSFFSIIYISFYNLHLNKNHDLHTNLNANVTNIMIVILNYDSPLYK